MKRGVIGATHTRGGFYEAEFSLLRASSRSHLAPIHTYTHRTEDVNPLINKVTRAQASTFILKNTCIKDEGSTGL